MFNFADKNILVTGGSGGIGKAIVNSFNCNRGSVTSIGSEDYDLKSDTSIKQLLADLPNIDICINCAGINKIDNLHDIKEHDFDTIMQVNVKAPFIISQHVSKHMKRSGGGKIINIASIWGDKTVAKRLCYTTSKSALIGMTKTLAAELAEYNIQVNTISPGFTDTKLTRSILTDSQISELVSKVPMKRMATPQEIANAVIFLCSDLNTYITGQNIIIDGGFSIT